MGYASHLLHYYCMVSHDLLCASRPLPVECRCSQYHSDLLLAALIVRGHGLASVGLLLPLLRQLTRWPPEEQWDWVGAGGSAFFQQQLTTVAILVHDFRFGTFPFNLK